MNDFEKELKRKILARNIVCNECNEGTSAINLTEENLFTQEVIHLQELHNASKELQKILENANSGWEISATPPSQCRRSDNNLIFYIYKKIARKLKIQFWGWFINPIIREQNAVNATIVKTLNHFNHMFSYTIHSLVATDQGLRDRFKILDLEINNLKERTMDSDERRLQLITLVVEQKKLINQILTMNTKQEKQTEEIQFLLEQQNVSCDLGLLKNIHLDYFAFEDQFRGDRNNVKNSQRPYVDYFQHNGGGQILDIGCGRGEFLELMSDYGISASGLDMYQPFVDYCERRGFQVALGDALTYLSKLPDCSLGGIFMGHVIEHVPNDYAMALLQMAYRKLKVGCYLIMESPNPESLSTLCYFNIDPTHTKPIHFAWLEFLAKETGFSSVERYDNPLAQFPFQATRLEAEGIANLDEFNQGINNINRYVFACRDYALIACK